MPRSGPDIKTLCSAPGLGSWSANYNMGPKNQIKYTACYIQVEKETPQTTSPAARMPNRTGALPSLHEKSFTGMPETMCICSYTVILYPFQNPRLFKSYPCSQDAQYFTISLQFHLHLNGMTNADRALLSPHATCRQIETLSREQRIHYIRALCSFVVSI